MKADNPDKPKRPPFHMEFAEKIIAHLKEGTAPWQKPWQDGKQVMVPHNPASGTVYKGMNRVSLALFGYDDPRWMTLRQANEQGLSILPGSKASPVVYYQWSKEVDRKGEDGRPMLGEDGKPEKVTVSLDRPIVRFAHVFNAEQIDGMPPLQLTDKAYEWNPEEKAENILSASGADIRHDQSNRAFYRYLTDTIHLPPKENFNSPGSYYGTALHELGHWTRHADRLDRENGPFGSELYAREELRAEIASWMLGQDLGIPHHPEQHAAYVASWIKALEDDPFEIMRACRDAEQIKDYVIGLEMNRGHGLENPATQRERAPEHEEGVAAMGLPAQEKTWLAVPYKEKEQAKRLGAKWDKEQKSWFAPQGADLSKLSAWLPTNEQALAPRPLLSMSPQDEFAAALLKAGLDLRGEPPVMNGIIQRVPLIDGKPGALDGAYCGYLDEHPAGWMQNFSEGLKTKWVSTGHTLSKEQCEEIRQEAAQKQVERAEQRKQAQEKAAEMSLASWNIGARASDDHPYLQLKGVEAFGLHLNPVGILHVPVCNVEGELRGLQTIDKEGMKRFVPGMEKQGNFHLINPQEKDFSQGEILLAEGYATGASLHMATGKPVAVAFDAGNLEPVAKALRDKFPNAAITICADNDHQHTRRTPEGVELWNKGVALAQEAAKAVGGKVIAPLFNEEERARGLTDFNDLQQSRGVEEVKVQVDLVLQQNKEKFGDKGQTRQLLM